MCACGRAVAMSVNLKAHKFKGTYMRAINTPNSDVPWVAFLVTSEICFSFDIAQQLWLPCKPSGYPGKHFLSRGESPREAASEFPVPCLLYFMGHTQGPCIMGRGEGEGQGELFPPSGSIPHNTFPNRGRLCPDEEIESEWAMESRQRCD